MSGATSTGRHLDDGAALRLIDGEAAPAERAALEAHAAACDACGERVARLRRRSVHLGDLLVRTDWPVPATEPPRAASGAPGVVPIGRARRPTRRTARSWLRAAAVLLVAAGIAVAAAPARAWLADLAGAAWERIAGTSTTDEAAAPAAAPTPEAPPRAAPVARVRFAAAGPALTLSLDPARAGDVVVLARSGATDAALTVEGDAAEVRVLPGSVRVSAGAGEAPRTVRIEVPAGVRRVRVEAGPGSATTVEAAEIDAGRRIEL